MALIRYQVTPFGEGFRKRHYLRVWRALFKLRMKLRRVDGPYKINDGPERTLNGVIHYLRTHIQGEINKRFVIEGSSYDQPKWVIRSVDITPPAPPTHPLIAWGEQWIGKSPYELYATGPPGPSDCSGFTLNAVKAVYKIDLPHSAEEQQHDPRFDFFNNFDQVEQGDFIFLNYGRKSWPEADHVELWDSPGRTLGSRPSTHGVNYYSFGSYDEGRIVRIGRLRAAK